MPRTLRDVIDGLAARQDRTAIVVRRQDRMQWSFAQLSDHIERLARGLLTRGIGRGKQVALFAPSGPEWIAAALAVIHAGAAATPFDVQFDAETLAHVL